MGTRHRSVAAAILVEAEKSFGVDLTEIWSKLIRQTVSTITEGRVKHPTFRKIVRSGKGLYKALPRQLGKDRRKAIAIAAARAEVVAQPERLGSIIDLGKTYRSVEEHEAACEVFRDNLEAVTARVKADEVAQADSDKQAEVNSAAFIRSYWYTWSVCEGERGKERHHAIADAWLGGISVSDHLNPAQITYEQGKRSCAGLGVAFGKLAEMRPDCPYAKARRAAAYLGRLSRPDLTAMGYYDRYDLAADKMNTPRPKDIQEAITWLTAGVAQAGRELQDHFLSSLAVPSQVSFNHLQTILVSASVS